MSALPYSRSRVPSYVVGNLLSNIQSRGVVIEFPITGTKLSEDWIQWFSHTCWPHMPPSHVKSDDLQKALLRVLHSSNR